MDYRDYSRVVARAVASEEYERGFLVCGAGQRMVISANRITGVRAAICHDTFSVRMSQLHNGANVVCLEERVVGSGLAAAIVETWLQADFSDEERHRRPVNKINALDEG